MSLLKNRRFQLESLEERTLLTAVPWGTGTTGLDDAMVATAIVVTDAVPAVAEVDDPTVSVGDGVNLITEADVNDTVYVSVYVKSNDPEYGVQAGYCSLYYDGGGFTPGAYFESSIIPNDTINDGYDYSTNEYISAFGGNPAGMTDAYGYTQWALFGTYSFTATTAGTYQFSNGMARNRSGVEKESWNFIREDFDVHGSYAVAFTSTTFTVNGDAPLPVIEGVTVEGYTAVYDGSAHTVTVNGTEEGDTIFYSADGMVYGEAPVEFVFGEGTVFVKVSRAGYNDFYASADVAIAAKEISVSGTTVADKDYDGTTDADITLGEVEGIIGTDDVYVTVAGAFPEALPGDYDVTVNYALAGEAAAYYTLASDSVDCQASIAAIDIEDVVVSDVEVDYDLLPHTIEVSGLREGDVVVYTYDGVDYDENPEFYGSATEDSSYEVTVVVSRTGHNDYIAAATLTIFAADVPEPGSLVVTTLEDVVDPYDNLTSLREAIAYAETCYYQNLIGATITFADDLAGTITLANGALVIDSEVAFTIDGADVISIDAAYESRVFEVNSGNIALEGLTLTNGTHATCGGAVYNAGELTLLGVTITDSQTSKYGGAVYSAVGASLTVVDSVFGGNEAATHGGAIFVDKEGSANISGSYFSENMTGAYGAALYQWSNTSVEVSNTIFVDNAAPNGTIRNYAGNLALTNVVVSGNNQGISSSGGTNTGTNVTISNNTRSALRGDTNASFSFYNSIIVNPRNLFNFDRSVTISGDCNLSTVNFGTNCVLYNGGDLFAADGYTLWGNNQAFDAGNGSYNDTEFDAKGNARFYNGAIDIGAVEQICTAYAATVVYNGENQNLALLDGPVTWVMYSEDGEGWSDELTYRNVGTYTFYVWCGNDYGDEETYLITGTITPLQLTVEGSYVKTKGYDGTTTADVVVGNVETLYDDVTVTATGEFASPEIGVWDVTVTYAVSGDLASNYYAPVTEILMGEIKAKEAPSMVVTTDQDVISDTDGLISLREALTVYYGTGGCTTVTFADDLTVIDLDSTLELTPDHNGLVIDGDDRIVFDGENFVIFYLTNDADLTFNGLTFQNITGEAFGTAFQAAWGCQNGTWKDVTFTNCNFTNNTAGYGSVMMVTGLNVSIIDCNFSGNYGSSRGAIWDIWNNLYVSNTSFENNTSTGDGGAICATTDSNYTLRIENSTFEGNYTNGHGGAVFSEMSNTFISDSVFTNNTAGKSAGAVTTATGANSTKQVTIDGCEFTGNKANAGDAGALRVYNFNGVTLNLTDSTFEDNTATGAGGALQVSGCNYTIDGCLFGGNVSNGSFTNGGAIHSGYGGTCTISNSQFIENLATGLYAGKGGAIHFTDQNGNITISDSEFFDNQAYAPDYYWAWGGAINREYGSGTLSLYNCSIVGNTAHANDGGNGTLNAMGGGVYMTGGGVLNLVQCLVAENTAISYSSPSYGGGIYLGSDLGCAIYYSTITNNETLGSSNSVGGGIFNGAATTILGSIVYGNVSPGDNLWDGAGCDIWQGGNLAFNYSLYDATQIIGNEFTADEYCYTIQDGDSLFAGGSYELADDSVAINGTNITTEPFSSQLHGFDLNGAPDNYRLCGPTVDYGAYEYQLRDEPSTVVTTGDDVVNDHDGLISLREAIAYAYESQESVTFAVETVNIDSAIEITGDVALIADGVIFTMSDDGLHGAFDVAEGASLLIDGGVFTGFTASVFVNDGTMEVTDVVIAGNTSSGEESYGAIYNTGNVVVTNSLILCNLATEGAALYNAGAAAVYSSTITGNNSGEGYAVYGAESATTSIYNTIVALNYGGNANVEMVGSYDGEEPDFVAGPDLSAEWSADAWVDWNLNLGPYSEAIEIGDNAYAEGIDYDFAGNDRICGTNVDAGAYEYTITFTPYTGVFDGDSHVAIEAVYAPTGYDAIFYSLDQSNWVEELSLRNAGDHTVYVWVYGIAEANDLYTSVTVSITPLQLTVEGSYVKDHAYDGTTTANVVVGDVATLYDDVTVTATGEFASPEVGTWDVAVTYTVSGDLASNYYAPVDETLTGNIVEPEAASMVVTTADDVVDAADGLISLREALTVYYGTGGCTTVTFADGLTTINLDNTLELTPNHNGLVIDGGNDIVFDGEDFVIFYLTNDANVTFNGLTFQNLTNDGFGTAFQASWACQGGGLADVTFTDCNFTNNNGGYGSVMMVTGLNARLDGCTFIGNGSAGSSRGAIWNVYGNVFVSDCTFENNKATNGDGGAITATADNNAFTIEISNSTFTGNTASGRGGAIYTEMRNLTITDSTFTNNSAVGEGGAIYATHWGSYYSSDLSQIRVVTENCLFEGNTSNSNGGAFKIMAGNITDTDSVFRANKSTGVAFARGGAIYFDYATKPSTFNGTTFEGNEAFGTMSGMGGAIFADPTGFGAEADRAFNYTDCNFVGNIAGAEALYYAYGGAIYIAGGYNNFTRCTITENCAYIASDTDGAGDIQGGALYIPSCFETRFNDCVITDNVAGGNLDGSTVQKTSVRGGAIASYGTTHFIQSLVADNTAYGGSKGATAGGIFMGRVGATAWYSTIYGNTVVNGSGVDIYNDGAMTALYSIIGDVTNVFGLSYVNTYYDNVTNSNSFAADADSYQIQAGDALFVEGGYTLAPHSVAIDATNLTAPSSLLDLNGDQRLRGFTQDVGAFEYQGAKIYVLVTLSDSIPDQEISVDVPVSTITTAGYGDTVNALVWVKSVDDSVNGITGGYVDVDYTDALLDLSIVLPSGIFADMTMADTSTDGLIATFGGLTAIEGEDFGVDSWALLGAVTFTVAAPGFATVGVGAPTVDGVVVEALDLSRGGEGAIADVNIEYYSASFSVTPAAPTLDSVTSAGANRHQVAWTYVGGIASYEVGYTIDGQNWLTVTATDTTTVVTGLTYGANVTYKVRAIVGDLVSDWSNEITLNVCPMDIDGDGTIGPADLALFRAAYLSSVGDDNWNPAADIDGDGIVGPGDYSYLRKNYLMDAGDEDLVYPAALAELDAAFESLETDDLSVDFDVF